MTRTLTGRARATLATITAVAALAPASAASAAPTTTTEATPAAAGWLASQLVDGERLRTAFGDQTFDDPGLTADAVIALAGAGVAADGIEAASSWLASQVEAYTGDGTDEVYAGATAKLLLVAEVTGADATAFGGVDLVARLQDRQQTSGRYADESAFGDFSNVITQSLAISALDRTATVSAPTSAVDYLVAQQCDDGGFPLALDADTCESSVDATGFAAQALADAGRTATFVTTTEYLTGQQNADGSFGDGEVANANATGLAAAALARAGLVTAVSDAQAWLAGIQEGCDAADPGAFPFSVADRGDVQRATAQALFGMAEVDFSSVDGSTASTDVPTFDCPKRYSDVAYGRNVHVPAINDLTARDVVQGRPDGSFGPKDALTRGQLATLVGRAGGFAKVAEDRFTDLEGSPHAGYINALADADIVGGFPDGTFRPGAPLTRDQAARIVATWLALDPVDEDQFDDLDGNIHRRLINALAVADIVNGTGARTFSPKLGLPRDQAATLVSMALTFRESQA